MSESLSNLFRRGITSLSRASNLPSIQDETQNLLESARAELRAARARISDLSLFSPNETLDDIATRDLLYLLVPFALAEAENRARATDRDARLTRLREAENNYREFVQSLEHYDIVSKDEQDLYLKNASAIADASRRRDMKIKQYKAEKEIRGKIETVQHRARKPSVDVQSDFDLIAALLTSPSAESNDDDDSDVEDAMREATLLLMRLFYAQTCAQLDHLADELQLLKNAPPPEPERPDEERRRTDEADWRLDAPRPGFGRGGPLLDPQGRPLQPFTILPSNAAERARLQAQVFQADHRLPSMTIDEYLEIERQRGNIITGGGAASAEKLTSKEQLAMDSEQDGTAFGEDKAEEKRQKDENWARYTDENPRGAGNTMNRG